MWHFYLYVFETRIIMTSMCYECRSMTQCDIMVRQLEYQINYWFTYHKRQIYVKRGCNLHYETLTPCLHAPDCIFVKNTSMKVLFHISSASYLTKVSTYITQTNPQVQFCLIFTFAKRHGELYGVLYYKIWITNILETMVCPI